MSLSQFLSDLRSRDITFRLDDGRLKCDAPPGAMTQELRDAVMQRKSEILDFLHRAEAVQSGPRSIIPIKADGSRPPLFALPGHNGDVFCYVALGKYIDPEQSIYGVQPPGLEGSEPLHSIPDLAAHCIRQIREMRPSGPYALAGFCAGGTVAFEIARQLTEAGEQVTMLMLLGSAAPQTYRRSSSMLRRLRFYGGRVLAHARAALTTSPRQTLARFSRTARALAPNASSEASPNEQQPRQRLEEATLSAIRDFRPARYEGRIDYMLPSEEWGRSGPQPWRWSNSRRSTRSIAVPSPARATRCCWNLTFRPLLICSTVGCSRSMRSHR